ncbi:MAG: 2-dehydropantoate 2-reductase [Gammaproteobacteria bacterium]|nr:2-dehydropantoate 2-reductase [Gammaproteobacteria bacterium]MCP5199698.1 2-dehydropantoate 2-reductase [Gammaproteobacteria bacterium]
MKIAIVGIGAMGSVYAGLLARGGHEVWGIDTWAEHVAAIERDGLRVEGASGDARYPVHATTDAANVGACDLVVVATKAADVAAAARAAAALLGPDTPVLTIQNGLGAVERLAAVVPRERILVGVAGGFGAALRGPGHAFHNGMELLRLGEADGGGSARLEAVAAAWRDGGFNVRCYDDINQLVWEKFICNVTFSGTCTVLGMTVGEVMTNDHAWQVALGCGLEAHAAGVAKGIAFSFDDAAAYIADFGARIPGAQPSMLLDHLARRRSEIDAINGMVPVVAAEVGTAAPLNSAIAALVRAREAGFP